MEDPKVFFAASGLTATVLVLWIRFWVDRGRGQLAGGIIGTAWCFIALLTLLAAIGLAAGLNWTERDGTVPCEAVGLFMAGLSMTTIAVGESGFHIVYNCWRWTRGHGPVARLVSEADFGEKTSDDEKKRNGWLRHLMVLCPATCAGFLILGFVLLSNGHFSAESSCFPWAVFCLAIAGLALVLVAGLVVDHTFCRVDEAKKPDPTTKECPFCLSTIPIKAARCSHCTSDLEPVEGAESTNSPSR